MFRTYLKTDNHMLLAILSLFDTALDFLETWYAQIPLKQEHRLHQTITNNS